MNEERDEAARRVTEQTADEAARHVTEQMTDEAARTAAKHIRVYGIVQGVGFRPFVSRAADRAGVRGSVANRGSYVEIFAQGEKGAVDSFLQEVRNDPPERSAVLRIDVADCEKEPFEGFEIIESEKEAGDIFVSPDIATCPKCRQELFDPGNRRYMHPFINCTACGPRLTILDSMPYDRVRTSMGEFPMCPACEWEYTHPETRRYDAQPVCCNDCGPEVYLTGRSERGREAITEARRAIMEGKIIAVKGIGGFHLCCDATNEEAVARLRRLKTRPAKPFAVMMRDMEAVRRECVTDPGMEEELDNHQKPIILLPKREGGRIAPSVAPDIPTVGVMLPYAPVQMLLFDYDDGLTMTTDCFVMTSGNVRGAPICRTDEDALAEIAGFCDLILSHNRKIRLRADDSVMDFFRGRPYMIRRSRGYAPLPLMMSREYRHHVLAVGGELKNTFCIGRGQLFYPSPYVGDMEDIRTVNALRESVTRMASLLEAEPEIAACDLHPKYNTTAVAKESGLPVMQIQHHYAHILSCMAENDRTEPVIGVSFDGTGYGTDGTIWGGEILVADLKGFRRAASIRPFPQAGGDASAREGWRIAVSMINRLFPEGEAEEIAGKLSLCEAGEVRLNRRMCERNINCVMSTSAGRLFDAVSAVLGIRRSSTYEGEASVSLQYRAEEWTEADWAAAAADHPENAPDVLSGDCRAETGTCSDGDAPDGDAPGGDASGGDASDTLREEDGRLILPTDRLFVRILRGRLAGEDVRKLAYEFHEALARQITDGVKAVSLTDGIRVCALSGGVFQNRLLLGLCVDMLRKEGFAVLLHSLVPPNDGGIALGQALAAMEALEDGRTVFDS